MYGIISRNPYSSETYSHQHQFLVNIQTRAAGSKSVDPYQLPARLTGQTAILKDVLLCVPQFIAPSAGRDPQGKPKTTGYTFGQFLHLQT
jgi:hypothetical protein